MKKLVELTWNNLREISGFLSNKGSFYILPKVTKINWNAGKPGSCNATLCEVEDKFLLMPMPCSMEPEQSHSWDFCLTGTAFKNQENNIIQEGTGIKWLYKKQSFPGNKPSRRTPWVSVTAMEPISMCWFFFPLYKTRRDQQAPSGSIRDVPTGFETHR